MRTIACGTLRGCARSALLPDTPGIVLAAEVSMPLMMPWAWLERTIQA
jgi:hypothetical protein